MKYFRQGKFYAREIHGENIPADAVEITDEEWRELLAEQSRGKRIVTGEDGRPAAVDPEPPPIEQLKSNAIAQLWDNYKEFQREHVDPESLTLAAVCAQQGSAKGAAVQQWVMRLWQAYYEKRDRIEAASDAEAIASIALEPDAEDNPPHTIRELNEEAAALLAAAKP